MESNRLLVPSMRRVFNWAALAAPVQVQVPTGQVWEIVPRCSSAGTAPDCCYIVIDNHLMWFAPNDNLHSPLQQFTLPDQIMAEKDTLGLNAQNIPVIADEGQVIEFGSFALTGFLDVDIKVHKRDEGVNSFLDGGVNGVRKLLNSYSITTQTLIAGSTVEILCNVPVNPAGSPVFPYLSVVPPQRRFKFLAIATQLSAVVGTNLTWNGFRIIHEGKSIISVPGDILDPLDYFRKTNASARIAFCPDDWYFDPYESIQIYARVTSTDMGPQLATIPLTIIMIEEQLGAATGTPAGA